MSFADDETEAFLIERPGNDIVRLHGTERHAEIERVLGQRRLHFGLGKHIDGDPDAGVPPVELPHERPDQIGREGWRESEPERAAIEVLDVMNRASAGFELPQRAAGVIDIRPAGVGRPDDPPRSIQKLGAEHLLQLPDLLGERRLGDVQLGRRAGEAAVIGDGDEVAGVAQSA